MSSQEFSVKINSSLVAPARQMHASSRVGDRRRGPGQSFEAYLSDMISTAIVERKKPVRVGMQERLNLDRKLSA